MESDALTLLIKQIEDEKTATIDTLTQGAAGDFADYRWMCGIIRGLSVAQRTVGTMRERMKQQDD